MRRFKQKSNEDLHIKKIKDNSSSLAKKLFFICVSFLLLLSLGLHRGAPYFFFNSQPYIVSGMAGVPLYIRSPVYGLFVMLTSFKFSLWITLIFQSSATVYVLLEVLRVHEIKYRETLLTFAVAVLVFTSAIVVNVCHIMADFSTPLSLLLLYILAVKADQLSHPKLIINALLFVMLGAMHISHISILFLLTLVLFIYRKRYSIPKQRFLLLAFLWLLITICNPTLNKLYGGEFKMSKSTYPTLNSRLLDHGILKPHLKKNCLENPNYSLFCAHLERIPNEGYRFIHGDRNFNLYPFGGKFDLKGENKKIFWDAMLKPQNLLLYGAGTVVDTLRLMVYLDIIVPKIDKPTEMAVKNYFPFEHRQLSLNKQDHIQLFKHISKAQYVFLGLCFLILILFSLKRLYTKEQCLFLYYILGSFLLNAFVMVAFAGVYARYQHRIVWLLPFFVIVFSLNHFITSHSLKRSPENH